MAKGTPDYYKGVDIGYQDLAELIVHHEYDTAQKVDIAIQALSEVIVRPIYGGANSKVVTNIGVGGGLVWHVEVSGKGMIYGGILIVSSTTTQKDMDVRLEVDNKVIANMSWWGLYSIGVTKEHAYPIYLLTYDDTLFNYAGAYSHGITFEESVKVGTWCHDSPPYDVTARFIYSLIT